jgi:hypothetical protein
MSIATALLLALCVVWPASLSSTTDAPSPFPETQEARP